jgi:hypothetical protein
MSLLHFLALLASWRLKNLITARFAQDAKSAKKCREEITGIAPPRETAFYLSKLNSYLRALGVLRRESALL